MDSRPSATTILEQIMAWSEEWDVNLRDNEPYYDLLSRVEKAVQHHSAVVRAETIERDCKLILQMAEERRRSDVNAKQAVAAIRNDAVRMYRNGSA